MLRIEITRGNNKKGDVRYHYEVTLNYNPVAKGEVLTPEQKLNWREILKLIANSDPRQESRWGTRDL